MERALRVVEPEEERPDSPTTALVPTKASNDTIRRARVLDLEHRALARFVDPLNRLGDDPIEAGAFKAIEPLGCNSAIARHRRQVDRRPNLPEDRFEPRATLDLREAAQIVAVNREQIEADEAGRRHFRELGDP